MIHIPSHMLVPCQCELGEGPFWHERSQMVYWVDILGRQLHQWHWPSGGHQVFNCPRRPSLIVNTNSEKLLVAVQGGLMTFHPVKNEWDWVKDLEPEMPDNRSNDGGCDSQGRLWVGTMDMEFRPGAGSLYMLDADRKWHLRLSRQTISNGMAFSADGKTLYHIDSPTRKVMIYPVDPDTGKLGAGQVLVEFPDSWGQPDGMAMDSRGNLWVAGWNGFGIFCLDAKDGRCLAKIELPVPQVSSCAFAGDRLDQMVITTARENMSPNDLAKYPQSGDLFVASPGISGLVAHTCNL